jgi:hypothetical protein
MRAPTVVRYATTNIFIPKYTTGKRISALTKLPITTVLLKRVSGAMGAL